VEEGVMSNGDPGSFSSSVSPTSHPQVARFTITLPADTRVTVNFGTDTNYGRSTAPVSAPSGGGTVSILVAGMLAATKYILQARIQFRDGSWRTTAPQPFTTGALPATGLPRLSATTASGHTPSPGVELVNVINPDGFSVVSDVAGNILWYYDNSVDASWGGYVFPIKPLKNGNLLASITNLYVTGVPSMQPYNSVLREIDFTGSAIRELTLASLTSALSTLKTPQGSIVKPLCYSHDVLPLWNGHVILLVQEVRTVTLKQPPGPGQFTILGDAIVDLDENFNPVWVWSTFDNLDPDRHPYEFCAESGYDWTHCNAVLQAPDGNLLLSSRHQNWVMKIRYSGGEGDGTILWKLGYEGDFALSGGDDTQWFFAQHFPHILGATDTQITSISVFDNGNDRCYATAGGCEATSPPPQAPFSRGAIFSVDETAMTAGVSWQYPLDQYSFWGGNVVALLNGDVEICASEPVAIDPVPWPCGAATPARSAAPASSVDTASSVVELTGPPSSPETVWQLTVLTGGAYRSYRIPSMYPGVIWAK
jgi:arylsulfate sulfotransferase